MLTYFWLTSITYWVQFIETNKTFYQAIENNKSYDIPDKTIMDIHNKYINQATDAEMLLQQAIENWIDAQKKKINYTVIFSQYDV